MILEVSSLRWHKNLNMYRTSSRQIGSGQTGDDKSEHQHFRKQWNKMDHTMQI